MHAVTTIITATCLLTHKTSVLSQMSHAYKNINCYFESAVFIQQGRVSSFFGKIDIHPVAQQLHQSTEGIDLLRFNIPPDTK